MIYLWRQTRPSSCRKRNKTRNSIIQGPDRGWPNESGTNAPSSASSSFWELGFANQWATRSHHDPEHIRSCKTLQREQTVSAQHSTRETVTENPHPSIKAWKFNLALFCLHAYCTHHVTRKLLFFQINLALLKGSGSQFTISMRQAQHSWGNYKAHLTLPPAHFNLGWKAISVGRRGKIGSAGPMLALQGMGASV